MPPGLIILHSNRLESLRDVLVAWMHHHPLAPLEQEVVLVQSSGMAQWLKLALATNPSVATVTGGGIAAALELLLPARFLWRVYRAVLGAAAVPEVSPLDKSQLVWRLMRLLPQVITQPIYAPLRHFLENDAEGYKCYQLAVSVADVFDQYQVYRADWLAAWAKGQDSLPYAQLNSEKVPAPLLPESQRWQAALWRVLCQDIEVLYQATHTSHQTPSKLCQDTYALYPGTEAPMTRLEQTTLNWGGRAAVHAAFMQRATRLDAQARLSGLPRRVIVFGISALPRQSLEVLAQLARWTQVLMCVHNPCEHYWADIIEGRALLRASTTRQRRRQGSAVQIDAHTLHLHAHPLLAAWGKQGRDFIAMLDEHDSAPARHALMACLEEPLQRLDLFVSPGTDCLLHQLQDDIRDLRPLHETRGHWPAVNLTEDHSIRFHVAHSRQREVEILHDQLLAALDADATLRPRDVMVMVPDIETYAPHIQAVFGLHHKEDWRAIPYTIADRRKRGGDALLRALEQLLQLPNSRFSVSDLMGLLEVPAVRQRFGIAADQIALLHRWSQGANIRWGLHDAQRQALDLPTTGVAAAQNSWLFGLRRLLLGYAVGAGEPWNEIEPYDDIGGLDAALLGPLVALIERLEQAWASLTCPATPAEWGERLNALLAEFFTATDSLDAYLLQQLQQALQAWRDVCAAARLTQELPLAVVAEDWLSRLDQESLSQRFFAGGVTFATLMPMRAIPFRMVCLLGMNEGEYPRAPKRMDFDLMAHDYRPGDRSRREDDRYLFLEAVLSARDRLYISWIGRSVRDNTPYAPSVLVGQLCDHLEAGWKGARMAHENQSPQADQSLVAALTTEHRLQPFSPIYFSGETNTDYFTYAREWQGHIGAGKEDCTPLCTFLRAEDQANAIQPFPPLPPFTPQTPLTLRELANFFCAPVEAFFKQRLQVSFARDEITTEDVEPFAPQALEQWQLQDKLIRAQSTALANGTDPYASRTQALMRLQRAGYLAVGAFGALTVEAWMTSLDDILQRYREALAQWPQAVNQEWAITLALDPHAHGVKLEDVLGGLRQDDQENYCHLRVDSRSLIPKGKYRIEAIARHWVHHVAAQLSGVAVTTKVVSKAGDITFSPLPVKQAQDYLLTWLQHWEIGMQRPLPMALKAAAEWLRQDSAAMRAARQVYEGSLQVCGEVAASPYLQAVYPNFSALTHSSEFFELAQTWLKPMMVALRTR